MAADRSASGSDRKPIAALANEVGRRFGVSLKECTPHGVEQRLRFRMAERAFQRVEDYAEYVLHSQDEVAWEALLETLTSNESRLFGAPADFAPVLQLDSDPRWSRYVRSPGDSGRFRCLSAACGTGEEAYSLAIALSEIASRAPGFAFEVLGADVSACSLAAARRAIYPASRASSLPEDLAARYLTPLDGTVSTQGLRSKIRFARVNLCGPDSLGLLGEFDLILARDFLPALTGMGRRVALTNLARALKPGGVLLLGPGDSPGEIDLGLFPILWGERHAYERPNEDAEPARVSEERPPEPKTALVAHRSPLVRAWLALLLEQGGYRVEEAPDGLRVLEHAAVRSPRDRYLLEFTLPTHGGPFVAQRLTRLNGVPASAVTYVSPRDGATLDTGCEPAGARLVPLPLGARDLDAALAIPRL
jgi:chemotaxis methyl-accepting protein methylase/CheY-like chemotaxis protein